jgi:hypothetical protein
MLPSVTIGPFIILNGIVVHETDFIGDTDEKVSVRFKRCMLMVLRDGSGLMRGVLRKQAWSIRRWRTFVCPGVGFDSSRESGEGEGGL